MQVRVGVKRSLIWWWLMLNVEKVGKGMQELRGGYWKRRCGF